MPFEPERLREALAGRSGRRACAASAPPSSTRRSSPAGRGRGRRRARSAARRRRPAPARGAARAPPAARARQRRPVVADGEVDLAGALAGPDRLGPDPVGPVLGAALLEEVLALDAVGPARHGQRPAGEVGEDRGRDPRVVVDHLALGEAGLRVEDLVEIGDRQRAGRRPLLRGLCPRLRARLRLALRGAGGAREPSSWPTRTWTWKRGTSSAELFGSVLAPPLPSSSPLTAARLSSSAAIRSGALVGFGASVSTETRSSPRALRSIRSSSSSRYSSL